MYGLALDTSNKLQISLFNKDNSLASFSMERSLFMKNGINLSDVILQYIADLLSKNQINIKELSFITLINGAGYFTGVRIAIVIAKILKLSLNIPVFTFSASYIMFKEVSSSLKEKNIVVATIDIGKSGCVMAVFNKSEQIIEDIYIDEESLEDFFKTNTILNKISSEDLVIIGNKQNLFKEIEYFTKTKYYDNLSSPSMEVLGMESILVYNKGSFSSKIEPLYAKDVDMIIKKG